MLLWLVSFVVEAPDQERLAFTVGIANSIGWAQKLIEEDAKAVRLLPPPPQLKGAGAVYVSTLARFDQCEMKYVVEEIEINKRIT